MSFEYICVGVMLLFCTWGGYVGLANKPEAFPLGEFGRSVLIFNSFVLGMICWATLAAKLIEMMR